MKHIVTLLSAAAALTLAACGSGSSSGPSRTSMTEVASAVTATGDLHVDLYTATRLETGLVPIYVKVTTADGQVVKDATVTVAPWMDMGGGMGHGAPMIGAPERFEDDYYACGVVFPMASMPAMGATPAKQWSLKVTVQRPAAAPVEASFAELHVEDSGRMKSVTDASTGARYLVSLALEDSPKVGLNPVSITVHTKQGTAFAPVDDVDVSLDPQMPSMGHGSPGSVAPTLTRSGEYEGQLSFSMTGEWETTVTLSRSGAVIGSAKFLTAF
jgi:hypothetical protein